MTEQEVFRIWVQGKYPHLTGIIKVEFELGANGPYSAVTPDVNPYVCVSILCDQGRVEEEIDDVHELIRELVKIG